MSIERIKQLQDRMNEKNHFKAGDLVRWKEGLRNRRFPDYGTPTLVAEVKPEPIFENLDDSGAPNFGEPLDLVLVNLDSDGDLVHYHFDSRRFELVA